MKNSKALYAAVSVALVFTAGYAVYKMSPVSSATDIIGKTSPRPEASGKPNRASPTGMSNEPSLPSRQPLVWNSFGFSELLVSLHEEVPVARWAIDACAQIGSVNPVRWILSMGECGGDPYCPTKKKGERSTGSG